MNMKMKLKNRSHRYYIVRLTSRHGCKYTKFKKCLNAMMLIYINQTPSALALTFRQ